MLARFWKERLNGALRDWKGSERALLGWAVLTGFAAGLMAVLLKRVVGGLHAGNVRLGRLAILVLGGWPLGLFWGCSQRIGW